MFENNWMPASKTLPAEPGDYLVLYGFDKCEQLYPDVEYFNGWHFKWDGFEKYRTVYWQKLPDHPDNVKISSFDGKGYYVNT